MSLGSKAGLSMGTASWELQRGRFSVPTAPLTLPPQTAQAQALSCHHFPCCKPPFSLKFSIPRLPEAAVFACCWRGRPPGKQPRCRCLLPGQSPELRGGVLTAARPPGNLLGLAGAVQWVWGFFSLHHKKEKQIEKTQARQRKKDDAGITTGPGEANTPVRQHEAAGCSKPWGCCAGARGYGDMSPICHQPSGAAPLPPPQPDGARALPAPAAPHLNDSPTQPRHVRQLLKCLCVGVVVLSKLCLHDLGGGERREGVRVRPGSRGPSVPPGPAPLPAAARR